MTTKPSNKIDWTDLYTYLEKKFTTKHEFNQLIAKIEEITAEVKLNQLLIKKVGMNITTKEEVIALKQEIIEQFSYLPSKEEFYTTMDNWMKATSTADIERPLHQQAHKEIRQFMQLHSTK